MAVYLEQGELVIEAGSQAAGQRLSLAGVSRCQLHQSARGHTALLLSFPNSATRLVRLPFLGSADLVELRRQLQERFNPVPAPQPVPEAKRATTPGWSERVQDLEDVDGSLIEWVFEGVGDVVVSVVSAIGDAISDGFDHHH